MAAMDVLGTGARHALIEVLDSIVSADGEVSDVEAAALRGAAVALGQPDGSQAIPLALLTAREVMLVYCAAAWIALADGLLLRAESRALEALREELRLDPETARMLAAHARWVRTSTERPWHRELDLLLTELARRLDKLEARAA